MKMRALGNSELSIAPIVFGGNVFGWTADEAMSFRLLDAFIDAGFNMIDTADIYSRWAPGHKGGESEAIIGKWLQRSGKRDRVLIATKVGMDMGLGHFCLKSEHILRSADDSLRRLQTDHIDLYQSHIDDLTTPVEETLEAFTQLVNAGKVRIIGASQLEPNRIRESLKASQAAGLASYQCLQPMYNLYDREKFESDYAPICEEFGLGVISFYGLAAGFLTGKYRTPEDFSKFARGAGIKNRYDNERGKKILAALDQVARMTDLPLPTIATAWVMNRPFVTAPIVSATSLNQLTQVLKATDVNLSVEAMKILGNI